MVPDSVSKEIALFQASPLSKKFFIAVRTEDPAYLAGAAAIAAESAAHIPHIKKAPATDGGFILSYYYYLPNIWSAELEQKVSALLDPEAVRESVESGIMHLMGPEGAAMKDFILADPIGMLGPASDYLKALNITSGSLDFSGGMLTSKDGKTALLIYDTDDDSFDRASAAALTSEVDKINFLLDGKGRVFTMGAARYTQENNDIIAKDVKRILILSVVLMLAIFLIFFRERYALFIYLVPVLVLVPSAVFTWLIFGSISGITLGFGSVLMGLAIDYSVYMYFAFKASSPSSDKKTVARAMLHPIMLSAATSIISFTALYFSSIPLFKQIGVFAVGGLAYALFIAFVAGPVIFKLRGERDKGLNIHNSLTPRAAVAITAAILLAGAVSVKFLRFDTSLDSLNTVSEEFVKDREVFDALTGDAQTKSSLLFVFGDTREDALDKSAALSDLVMRPLALSDILVSQNTAERNVERWRLFWNAERTAKLEREIKSAASEYGIKAEAYEPFFTFLKTARRPERAEQFDLTRVYNPFTSFEGREAVVHVVDGDGFELPDIFEQDSVFVSQNLIQAGLFYSVMHTVFIIIAVVFLIDFVLLMFMLKDSRLVLLAFVPILCALSVISVISVVFGVKVNLFSLFSIPLIIGLAVDYAIFIIHQKISSAELHPSRAVTAAALLSIAGFGALIAAEHKVLFAIGLTITIGITAALIVSVYLLPAIMKNYKKTLPVILCLLLLSCGGLKNVNVNYNVSAVTVKSEAVDEHYGELGGKLLFNSAAAVSDESVRVIVLSDIGIKLADFTVSERNIDMHSYQFIPRVAARTLAGFFRDFYYEREMLKVKQLGDGKISYNNANGSIVLWSADENGK
ncbi:putative exporter [Parelusimicrobium proximum]